MNPRLMLLLAAVCAPCWAQVAPAAGEARKAAPAEPAVQHIVVQGRDTRIDELRVRGQTRRIVVTGAGGTRYEVIPADGLRDLPDATGTSQGAAGKRVWRVLNF